MKKFSLNTMVSNVQLVAQRFPVALFFLFGLVFCFFLQINKPEVDIPSRWWAFFSLGIALSIAVTLFLEEVESIYFRLGCNLLSVALLLAYALILPEKFMPVNYYQLVAIGLVFILSAFTGSFLKKNNDIPFWEFSKTCVLQLLIAFVFSHVLMLGLSLAVLSLQELFKVNIKHEVYENLAVVCFALFGPIYFLANVPDRIEKYKQEYSFNKFLKIKGLYIVLPILVIYSLILYVYLIQIIIKWELPNGWVSALVSVLGLGGFLFMLLLYPLRLENDNKVVNLFSKYFPLLLFPLLVLMSVGIFRRLGDYGLTINRCYVLILNAWLYGISIYLFLSRAKHLKWIVISFATIAFLGSVGPWSVFHITKRTLVSEIGQLLSDAKLLKDGKVMDNTLEKVKVDSTLSNPLNEKLSYFYRDFGSEGIQMYFDKSIKKIELADLKARLGLKEKGWNDSYFNLQTKHDNQLINVESYKSFIHLSESGEGIDTVFNTREIKVILNNGQLLISKNKEQRPSISISLKEKIKQLKVIKARDKKDMKFNLNDMTFQGENYKLIISYVIGEYKVINDSLSITSLQGYLFLK